MGYVRWHQVQAQLLRHWEQTGQECSFADAVLALCNDAQQVTSGSLPSIPFIDWDTSDLDDLSARMDQLPIDTTLFLSGPALPELDTLILRDLPPVLDVLPLCIARHQTVFLHMQSSFRLFFVIRGQGRLHLKDNSVILESGTFCLVSSHTVHDIEADPGRSDNIIFSIVLSERTIDDTLSKLLRRDNIISEFFRSGLRHQQGGYLLFPVDAPQPVLVLIRSLFHECYGGEEFSKEACASYLELLLIHLLRLGSHYEHHITATGGQKNLVPIFPILQYIQREYRTVTLGQVAKRFHFEPSHLSRQIKAHTGKNFSDLVIGLKTAEAKNLLEQSDLDMKAIAEHCGYSSADYFSRSFMKAAGMRPTAWRKQVRNCTDHN